MEIFLANFLETKRLSLMNSGDLYKMLHCMDYMHPSASRGMGMGVIKTWSSFMTDSHLNPQPHPTPLLTDVLE